MKHEHHHGHHHDHVEADHTLQHQYPHGVRFCPMCGGALETRVVEPDRKEHKVCTRCGFVYFLNPKLVAGCLIIEGERTLLIRRGMEPARGKWTYPGGYVDLGETPERCAIRETHEEIGMTIASPELLGVYADRAEKAPSIIVVTYVAKPGPEAPTVTDEATEIRYFSVAEIPWDDLAFDTTRQALEAWRARR
ncbi:MAG TPA: NUDIX hydrolase [Candidatus Binataceae bacterium]|nr:NUDIX hydrolase [Candidatus Binataceae bacterium]